MRPGWRSRWRRTRRLRWIWARSQMTRSLPGKCRCNCPRKATTWVVRMAPVWSRKQKERLVSPAIAESFCQLKLNSKTGVWPIGAQVRTR